MALFPKIQWNNNQPPAINADNLNRIEEGIYQISLNSLTDATLAYSDNTLTLVIKNTAGTIIATRTITIPTDSSIVALGFDTSDDQCLLRYKTNANSDWTNVLDLATIFYTQSDINGCFTEVDIQED